MKHGIWAFLLAITTPVWAVHDLTLARIDKINASAKLTSYKVGQEFRFAVIEKNGHFVVHHLEPEK
jgi:hypothetical protein